LHLVAAFAGALSLTAAAPAFAQGKEGIAEGLYNEGKKLLESGNVPAACQKFKASLDVDRALGTIVALATCHEKEGKTASAWGEYAEGVAEAKKQGKADAEKYCRDRMSALEKGLSHLTVSGTKTDKMEIKIDGVTMPPEALGSALPADPGERTIEVTAPGYKPWSTKVLVPGNAGNATATIPALEVDPNATKKEGPIIIEAPKGTDSTKLIVGAAVAGVGLIGAGIGLYLQFGLVPDVKKQADDARARGDEPTHDTKLSAAKVDSAIGITSIIVGGIAVAAGTFLIITSFNKGGEKPAQAKAGDVRVLPLVGRDTNGLAVVGAF
jgi:hypothetical protein